MRLHALTVDAFGPFVGPQHVDFDELGSAGLFLVHGPTGAGKTSVLDAVCFALFSDVPGARASRGLRADLAAADRPTAVTLEFSSAGRRFRITRSPEFLRPKVRGTGLAKAPARVTLSERTDGTWVVRSARIDEAADLIKDVVGMGLAQFQRVALLPQGQFADFLRAEPRDRHQLLTALFDVATYADVETWLADLRRSHADTVGRLTLELDYGVRALAELCGGLPRAAAGDADPLPLGASAPVARAGDRATLAATAAEHWATVGPELLADLDAAATQALGDAEQAARQAMDCQSQHDEAVRVARLVRRGADAEAALARLTARSVQIEDRRGRVHRAALAGELRGELAGLVKAEQAHSRAQSVAVDSRAGLGAILGWAVDPPRIAALAAGAAAARAQLEEIRAALAEARAAATARRRALTTVASAGDLLRICTAEQQAAALRHATRAEAHLTQRDLAAGLLPARAAHDQAVRVHTLITDLIGRLTALEEIAPEVLTARESLVTAREDLVGQQERRLADLAGELAARLSPDTPCPVCGSAEHPEPAPAATGWSPEALAAAETAVTGAAERLARLEREQHATEAVRDRVLAELIADGVVDPRSLEQAASAGASWWAAPEAGHRADAHRLRARVEEATAAAAALPEIEAAAAADTAEAEAGALAVARAEAGVQTAGRTAVATAEHLATATTRLARALADHADACPCTAAAAGPASLAGSNNHDTPAEGHDADRAAEALTVRAGAVLTGHQRFATALDLARGEEEDARAAQEALTSALREFAAALAESGFPDRAALEAALLPVAETARLQDEITTHEQQVAINQATLRDPEVAAARETSPTPDPEATAAALATAREDAQRTDRARHDTERIARSARTAVARVLEEAGALLAAREDLARVAALADLAGGTSPENTLRMRLSTFVLASRLERVVDLANERLLLMGEGRFQLEHDDSLAGRGARSGLGLRVRDNWSGTTRSPSSLSGGESFIASLALALGLADALRESVGGIELQTLFIDEGFGALDESSLDDVLGVLDALRDGGRAVGVVSHVPELRDRIPAQLTVTKSPQGSTLATTTSLARTA